LILLARIDELRCKEVVDIGLEAFIDDMVDFIHFLGIGLKLIFLKSLGELNPQNYITILTLLDIIEDVVFEISIISIYLNLHFR
jgi:hypothetical protein